MNSTEVFERFEPLMKRLGGRPHWGKNYTITREEAMPMYPSTYKRFCDVRDALDTNRVFANSDAGPICSLNEPSVSRKLRAR